MCATNQCRELNRLMEYLTINNVSVMNSGLFHGKIGVVICFCEYARYLNDDIYLDLAGELLAEIFEEINSDIPVNFENGICGIGWGIEYLIQKEYMAGDTDEILEEVDARIMQIDINRIKDFSIETGLGGIASYIIARLTSIDRLIGNYMPFDLCYLENWMRMLPVWLSGEKCQGAVLEIFAKLLNLLHGLPNIHKEFLIFPSFIPLSNLQEIDFTCLGLMPKGLDGGIAGMALQIMKQ